MLLFEHFINEVNLYAVSDSNSCVYDRDGITPEKLEYIKVLKNEHRGRISEFAEEFGLVYEPRGRRGTYQCDIAFPSATQNEINLKSAKSLITNGVIAVGEGANMPSTIDVARVFQSAGVLYGPAKAEKAGGVPTSSLEMAQNSQQITWTREEVDKRLHKIMSNIHAQCLEYGQNGDKIDYIKGANVSDFVKVADAMIAQGIL